MEVLSPRSPGISDDFNHFRVGGDGLTLRPLVSEKVPLGLALDPTVFASCLPKISPEDLLFVQEARQEIVKSDLPPEDKAFLLRALDDIFTGRQSLRDYTRAWLFVSVKQFCQRTCGVVSCTPYPQERLAVPLTTSLSLPHKRSLFTSTNPSEIYEIEIDVSPLTAEEAYFIENIFRLLRRVEMACQGLVSFVHIEYEQPESYYPETSAKRIKRITFRVCSESTERGLLAYFHPEQSIGARFGLGEFSDEEMIDGQTTGSYRIALPLSPLPWADNFELIKGLKVSTLFYHLHDRYHRADQILLGRKKWHFLEEIRRAFTLLAQNDPKNILYRVVLKNLTDKEAFFHLDLRGCVRKALVPVFIYFSKISEIDSLMKNGEEGILQALQIFLCVDLQIYYQRKSLWEILVDGQDRNDCHLFLDRLAESLRCSMIGEGDP